MKHPRVIAGVLVFIGFRLCRLATTVQRYAADDADSEQPPGAVAGA